MRVPTYYSEAIREIWEKEAKQRWDGRTHGRGLGLLIVDILTVRGLMLAGARSRGRAFEFWRDQKKIRGRFIGDAHGNGIVVARLDEDGLPLPEQ